MVPEPATVIRLSDHPRATPRHRLGLMAFAAQGALGGPALGGSATYPLSRGVGQLGQPPAESCPTPANPAFLPVIDRSPAALELEIMLEAHEAGQVFLREGAIDPAMMQVDDLTELQISAVTGPHRAALDFIRRSLAERLLRDCHFAVSARRAKLRGDSRDTADLAPIPA